MKLPIQAAALHQFYPDSHVELSPRGLFWQGIIRPSEIGRVYMVSLAATDEWSMPNVKVIDPVLQPDRNGLLPHVWNDGSLCLSRPGERRHRSLFTDTTIPWASEWLFFYEIWRATMIWMGDNEAETQVGTTSVLHDYSNTVKNINGLSKRRKI